MICEQVVIAKCNENVDWVKCINKDYIIYNKGDEEGGDFIRLANEGREGDTWLRHILRNYHCLPEITYFLQGNPFEHIGIVLEFLNAEIKCESYLPLGAVLISNEYGKPHHPNRIKVGKAYRNIFGKEKNEFRFVAGAQYAVNKKMILNKSYNWWERLYDTYRTTKNSAWIFERLWISIWEYSE